MARGDKNRNKVGELLAQSQALSDGGMFDEARKCLEEAVRLARAKLPQGDELLATVLSSLGCHCKDEGAMRRDEVMLERADKLQQEALTIRQQLGDAAAVANSLFNLGGLCQAQNRHREAAAYFSESIRLLRQIGQDGAGGPVTFICARMFYSRVVGRVVGELSEIGDVDDFVSGLRQYAVMFLTQPDFSMGGPLPPANCVTYGLSWLKEGGDVSLPYLDAAIDVIVPLQQCHAPNDVTSAIKEDIRAGLQQLATQQPAVAMRYHCQLGREYQLLELYGDAKTAFRAALELSARCDDQHEVANVLQAYANFARATGDYLAATTHYQQAISQFHELKGPGDDNTLSCLLELAVVRGEAGDVATALSLFQELSKLFNPDAHRMQRLECEFRIADVLFCLRHFEESLSRAHTCLESLQRLDMKRGQPVARLLHIMGASLHGLGRLQEGEKKFSEARTQLEELGLVGTLEHANLLAAMAALYADSRKSSQAINCAELSWKIQCAVIKGAALAFSDSQKLQHLAAIRRTSARLLGTLIDFGKRDSRALKLAATIWLQSKATATITQRALSSVLSTCPEEVRRQLSDLSELYNPRLERFDSTEWDGDGATPSTHRSQRLEELERLLETVTSENPVWQRLFRLDPDSIVAALAPEAVLFDCLRLSREDEASYFVFSWSKGMDQSAELRLVELGLADEIDLLVDDVLLEIERGIDLLDTVSSHPARELARRIVAPLQGASGGRRMVFWSPDGPLGKLPLDVLPDQTGRMWIDEVILAHLTAPRELCDFVPASDRGHTVPVVIAAPDFSLGYQPQEEDRKTQLFDSTEGMRQEGALLGQKLGVTPVIGVQANKAEVLRRLSSGPSIVHIASHGILAPAAGSNRGTPLEALTREAKMKPYPVCGIALAGINNWLVKRHFALPDNDTGFLSVSEVSQLDLHRTSLVTLSACDTAAGRVHHAEGIFGLSRAFFAAGASTLVASLWKVPDASTLKLMERFYDGILQGIPVAQALRIARLAVRQTDPATLHWGAFVSMGNPGPVRQGVIQNTCVSLADAVTAAQWTQLIKARPEFLSADATAQMQKLIESIDDDFIKSVFRDRTRLLERCMAEGIERGVAVHALQRQLLNDALERPTDGAFVGSLATDPLLLEAGSEWPLREIAGREAAQVPHLSSRLDLHAACRAKGVELVLLEMGVSPSEAREESLDRQPPTLRLARMWELWQQRILIICSDEALMEPLFMDLVRDKVAATGLREAEAQFYFALMQQIEEVRRTFHPGYAGEYTTKAHEVSDEDFLRQLIEAQGTRHHPRMNSRSFQQLVSKRAEEARWNGGEALQKSLGIIQQFINLPHHNPLVHATQLRLDGDADRASKFRRSLKGLPPSDRLDGMLAELSILRREGPYLDRDAVYRAYPPSGLICAYDEDLEDAFLALIAARKTQSRDESEITELDALGDYLGPLRNDPAPRVPTRLIQRWMRVLELGDTIEENREDAREMSALCTEMVNDTSPEECQDFWSAVNYRLGLSYYFLAADHRDTAINAASKAPPAAYEWARDHFEESLRHSFGAHSRRNTPRLHYMMARLQVAMNGRGGATQARQHLENALKQCSLFDDPLLYAAINDRLGLLDADFSSTSRQ